jgi:sodium/potassium/calcium exchanger 6
MLWAGKLPSSIPGYDYAVSYRYTRQQVQVILDAVAGSCFVALPPALQPPNPPPPPPMTPAPADCSRPCGQAGQTCIIFRNTQCSVVASVMGCDCGTCCSRETVRPPPPPPPLPPKPPPPGLPGTGACGMPCGGATCGDFNPFSCDAFESVLGCDCSGCCASPLDARCVDRVWPANLPALYNFQGGVTGYYIADGGRSAYDIGNELLIRVNGQWSSPLYYNQVCDGSHWSPTVLDGRYASQGDVRYVTCKLPLSSLSYYYPGYGAAFIFIASSKAGQIDGFMTLGNLGADKGGAQKWNNGGSSLKGPHGSFGYYKKTYGAGEGGVAAPSINHLIFGKGLQNAEVTVGSTTDSDLHELRFQSGITQMYYILFLGKDGYEYPTAAFQEVLDTVANSCELSADISPDNDLSDECTYQSLREVRKNQEEDRKDLSPCEFAREQCKETGNGNLGSYVVSWQCTFNGNPAVLLLNILLLLIFIQVLCGTAGVFLEPQLTYMSNLLHLKPDIAGVTLLAFGNGGPDLFTGLAVALAHPDEMDYSLIISYTSGATLYIMTVVVGCIVFIASFRAEGWRLSRFPFYRDLLSFTVSMIALMTVSLAPSISLGAAMLLVSLYVCYVVLVIFLNYCVQPYWPDDTFGIYLSQKMGPSIKKIANHPAAQKMSATVSPMKQRLKRQLTKSGFATAGKKGLLGNEVGRELNAAPLGPITIPSVSPLSADGEQPNTPASNWHDVSANGSPEASTLQPMAPLQLVATPMSGVENNDQNNDLKELKGGGGDDDDEGLEDLDFPWDAGIVTKFLFCVEFFFSILRRLTIPCDAIWDERRRKWVIASPTFALALLIVFLTGGFFETMEAKLGPVPHVFLWPPLIGLPLSFLLWFFTRPDVTPKVFPLFVLCGFVMSIVWMGMVASEVVALIETMGINLGLSTSILGMTIIAWGNSMGDMMANVAVAKGDGTRDVCKKGAKMALAACFGSPMLMNLVGTGGALVLHILVSSGGGPVVSVVSQTCRVAFLFMAIALASHLVVFPSTGYAPPRKYAYYLWTLYAVFLLFVFLAEGKLLGDFLGGAKRP